jgi:hypothetical protein
MADSGTLRVRRHRLHKAGNHLLCRPGSCEFAQVSLRPVKVSQVLAGSGKDFDPLTAMTDLAAQLKVACEANPADAVLAREYRLTLMELAKGGDRDGPDPFAEIVKQLTGPVPAEMGDAAD